MRDVMEGARDAWWLTLVIPLKLAWRSIWRMVIFATGPDVYERVKTDYEREHLMRMEAESENEALRTENDRLRRALAGSGALRSNRRSGISSSKPTDHISDPFTLSDDSTSHPDDREKVNRL
jgi:hypothetical protein